MKIKIKVQIGFDYKTITQKQAKQVIGDTEFNNLKAEFIELVKNANDYSYLDFKAFKNGYVFYFEKV